MVIIKERLKNAMFMAEKFYCKLIKKKENN